MIPCPVCGVAADPLLLHQAAHLRPAVARVLRAQRPDWQPAQGVCPGCAQAAADAFARGRSAFPLHTRTEPHTTFPYYHPDEETVLGLPERLADAFTFGAQGVTIGFLDSGYYPHPDLCRAPLPAGVNWERLSPRQWRAYIEAAAPRLADYVDLSGGHYAQGLGAASLWDGQGVAWHGQMTTVIAAGNGALSGGRFRGFAPHARLLPIKVGRGDGRIPESDILAGLEWLLAHDRFAAHNVRVLNVSIGGDFDQEWQRNPVCLAAEALSARGVLVVAAAGNRAAEMLVAPAQSPSVLTVGGVDDANRPLTPARAAAGPDDLALYHHNYGVVRAGRGADYSAQPKPDLLAPAAWLPGPVLPISPVFREAQALARLRRSLRGASGGDDIPPEALVAHWQRVLEAGDDAALDEEETTGEWMGEVWQVVRQRMNAHKWVHAAYQHVDGTSVAAAVVSGVAAQMVQANPHLTPVALRALLAQTALPLPHLPAAKQGAGLVQPAAAVAAALRAAGGPLAGIPHSGNLLAASELRKAGDRVTVLPSPAHADAPHAPLSAIYFGFYAPAATAVALTGAWDCWQARQPLTQAAHAPGWWHAVLWLPAGAYAYRFWVQPSDGPPAWLPDPESTHRAESGYTLPHSVVTVTG